ncbi:MAG: lnt [Parachlamydiales bacterium]|nr:lnt [Parachlamydiales bacterium]
MNLVWAVSFVISLIFVAFGQNAWLGWLGPVAATAGYAIFWRGMLDWPTSAQRFVYSLIWFSSAHAFQLSWMSSTEYMGPLILVVYVFLLIALGVQFGLLSLFVGSSQPLTIRRCAALSGIWVMMEWVRLLFLTGFTWNPAGLALTTTLYSLQSASLFGIYGLSFWVIFVNLLALRASRARSRSAIVAFAACALLPFVFGAVRTSMAPKGDTKTISALLVQTDLLPQQRDYDSHWPDAFIYPFDQWDRILGLMDTVKTGPIDLIVFPEGALPYDAYHCVYPLLEMQKTWMQHYGAASQKELPPLGRPSRKPLSHLVQHEEGINWNVSNAYWVQALANHYQCEVIVGMDDRDLVSRKHYNAAFHFLPRRNTAERTEKRILVPVGEYVPLKEWRLFSEFLARQFGIGESFESGNEAKVFLGQIPIGVSICYEETYSELIRELRVLGAQMFVNISNDVWFPHSRLAMQHFNHGLVRAVENGVPLIRACNTGITGGVDCWGRTIATEPECQPLAAMIRVPMRTLSTLYSFWGDGAILFLSALFALSSFFSDRNKKRPLPEIKKVD